MKEGDLMSLSSHVNFSGFGPMDDVGVGDGDGCVIHRSPVCLYSERLRTHAKETGFSLSLFSFFFFFFFFFSFFSFLFFSFLFFSPFSPFLLFFLISTPSFQKQKSWKLDCTRACIGATVARHTRQCRRSLLVCF